MRVTSRSGCPILLMLILEACGGSATGPTRATLASSAKTVAALQSIEAPTATPIFRSFGFAVQMFGGASIARAAPGAVFPPDVLGKTFVSSDAAPFLYAASSDSGAPANGVRFVVYALGPGGPPAVPLAPIGHIDLTDQSAGGTLRMGVQLVGVSGGSSLTYADYVIAGVAGTAQLLEGYVTDGMTRLDRRTAYRTESLAFSAAHDTLDLTAKGIRLVFGDTTVTGDTTEVTTRALTMTNDAEVVALNGVIALTYSHSGTTQTGTFVVTVNGASFATVETDLLAATTTSTGAGGVPLRPDEQNAVLELLGAVDALQWSRYLLIAPGLTFLRAG